MLFCLQLRLKTAQTSQSMICDLMLFFNFFDSKVTGTVYLYCVLVSIKVREGIVLLTAKIKNISNFPINDLRCDIIF